MAVACVVAEVVSVDELRARVFEEVLDSTSGEEGAARAGSSGLAVEETVWVRTDVVEVRAL
ncbi:MAG: hypothetical protein AAF191_20050 [Verrucomicrobiota bacterium]